MHASEAIPVLLDLLLDICCYGSANKFTAFERKLLNIESKMTSSDDNLYYLPPLKKKKLKKVKKQNPQKLRTHTIKTVN